MAESLEQSARHLPAFASEAEEAAWWFANREKHAEEFIRAEQEGKVRMNVAAERLARAQGMVSLKLADKERQQLGELAQRHGLTVESYLHQMIQERLALEANVA